MKTLNKVIALILILVALVPIGSARAFAQKDELSWDITDGVLTISGKGKMPDYKTDVAPWRSSDKTAAKIKRIEVEYGVTHIGNQAFQYCENAKKAYIPDSVTSLGEAAFYGCESLKEVRLPTKLSDDELPVSIFGRCTSLKNVVVPEGVEVIKNAAFNCCESLEWVYIPASVEEIENSAFNACSKLKDVYYGGSWSDWDDIEIEGYNKYLKNANIHFNSDIPA